MPSFKNHTSLKLLFAVKYSLLNIKSVTEAKNDSL